MKQLSVCLLLLFSLVLFPSVVLAQEVIEVSTPSGITTRETLDAEIAELRTLYRAELEEYRTAERQAEIANSQYSQLETLASLEAAVASTRRAMIARAEVLELFLTLLKLQMTDATGINLDDKNRSLTRLDAALAEISVHQIQVESAADRNDIAQITLDFEVLSPQVEEAAYEAQSFLAVGKLQTVYDKTVALSQEVRENSGETTELKQAERDRAYNEIQTTLERVGESIDEATPVLSDFQKFDRSVFSRVLRDLGSVYTGLSQSLSFIEEFIRL